MEAVFDGFSCANCQLVNVEFSDSQLQGVNFSNSYLNQVIFFKSNLNRAKFNNSKLTQVEFSQCNNFKEATFDNCQTIYNLEKNEILIFNNCNLNDASFKKALLCSKLEDCNLSQTDFSLSTLVACKFYNCKLSETIFSNSHFKYVVEDINNNNIKFDCYIGVKPDSPNQYEFKISKCKFDGALMNRVEISKNTKIEEGHFEATGLCKSKLRNCEFSKTHFTSKIMKSADLSDADISGSTFKDCCLNEVKLLRVKMIEAEFDQRSQLVKASFRDANLRGSKFLNSNLTGVDFRYADLTLLTLDKCTLNCANFLKSKRGGIKLGNIKSKNE